MQNHIFLFHCRIIWFCWTLSLCTTVACGRQFTEDSWPTGVSKNPWIVHPSRQNKELPLCISSNNGSSSGKTNIQVENGSSLLWTIYECAVRWRPLEVVLIITAAKEEVRTSSIKLGKDRWVQHAHDFHSAVGVQYESRNQSSFKL